MNPWVKMCLKLYRKLARAFPHEFQMVYGEDVVRLGRCCSPDLPALRVLGSHPAGGRPRSARSDRISERAAPGHGLRLADDLKNTGIRRNRDFSLSESALFHDGFTQINSLVLKPLPGASDPEALVTLASPVPYPFFESYRDQNSLFTGAGAFVGPIPFEVSIDGAGNSSKRGSTANSCRPATFQPWALLPRTVAFSVRNRDARRATWRWL